MQELLNKWTELSGAKSECISDTHLKKLIEEKYESRVIYTTVHGKAKILRGVIQSKVYDTTTYPSLEEIETGGEVTPELTKVFIAELTKTRNRGDNY